jgi:hypothetical protein
MDVKEQLAALEKLRAPFPPNQVSKMCRSTKKDNAKGVCPKCKGWHGLPAIQLDYVGHAALTDRLLSVDLLWTWRPVAVGANGAPMLDGDGGMWIELTVCGVTRLGYGDAQGKTGGDATKERIGDALRNAAMRFGCALDLWHKGDLHKDDDPDAAKDLKEAAANASGHTTKTSSAATVERKDGQPPTSTPVNPKPSEAKQGAPSDLPTADAKSVAADLKAMEVAKDKQARFTVMMAAKKKYGAESQAFIAIQRLYEALNKPAKEGNGPKHSDVPQDPRDDPPPLTDEDLPF